MSKPSGCCSNAQLKAVVSEVFDVDDFSCGCVICTCGSKNEDLPHDKIAKRPKRSTFPEVLFDYLKENKPSKYGVRWVQHGVLQPTATVLDCIEVDWDILLTAHKSVKTKQNLVKSFTNWKFVKIKEKPELWFCDQLDGNGRSLFRPDNPQLTKLIKITNDNNQLNPSFGFQNKKLQPSNKNSIEQIPLQDFYRPLIDTKLGENTIESIIWYKALELGQTENYNEVTLSSFVNAANMILTQRGIQFHETELYLFIGRKIPNSDEKIVTLDSLVKFVRNFGPWNSITNKMQHFLQDGARDWYHGSLSDQEATHILTSSTIGSYLVRNYPTDDAHFAINYLSTNRSIRTIFITRTQTNDYHFSLEQNQILSAPTITTLLDACKDALKHPIKKDSETTVPTKTQRIALPLSESPLSPLSSNDNFTPPQSPFLPSLPPIFSNSIPTSPGMVLPIPSTPKLDSQEPKLDYLVIRVKLTDEEFFKEIRFSSVQVDYEQLKEAIIRKLHLKAEQLKHIVKNGNVLVDEDNVEFLLQNQELTIHLVK